MIFRRRSSLGSEGFKGALKHEGSDRLRASDVGILGSGFGGMSNVGAERT